MSLTTFRPQRYSLILLGDVRVIDREEYDPEQGTWRAPPPGDPWPVEPLSPGRRRQVSAP
jgi:hypothetical protein